VNFCNFFEVFCEFLCARFFVGDVGLRPHTTLVVEALWKRCAGFMQGLCVGFRPHTTMLMQVLCRCYGAIR
jgi:predicted membrane protein